MIQMYHVDMRYSGGTVGLHDVSMTIERGEFVFLTGPSGAGKTTLLRMLFGAERPSSGQVLVAAQLSGALAPAVALFLQRQLAAERAKAEGNQIPAEQLQAALVIVVISGFVGVDEGEVIGAGTTLVDQSVVESLVEIQPLALFESPHRHRSFSAVEIVPDVGVGLLFPEIRQDIHELPFVVAHGSPAVEVLWDSP